jgi:protocatechuate 3,4-dioxygenase beta subunit
VLKSAILITSLITDSNGNYIIPSISQGGYSVRATIQDFQTAIIGSIVQSNQTTTVNFSLQTQPGIIIGQVISQLTMSPIPGAIVDVLQGNILIASTFTDSNGDYNIPVFAPGNYIVRAGALNFQIQVKGTAVQSNQITVVNFSLLTDPGIIVGRVADSVTTLPIVGGIVDVFSGEVLIASVLTDSNGDFIISSLAPGNYTVLVSAFNYQIASQAVFVQSNQTSIFNFLLLTEVPLPPSGISGKVLCVEFLTQKDRIHRIKWNPSLSPEIIKYYVFQDGVQIASIQATKPLVCDNHNRNKKKSIVYNVKAVNSLGNESEPVSIILK